MVIFFLFGAHAFVWGTTSITVRQRAVPSALQGRVRSVNMVGVFGGLVVGSALGGLLASTWGVTAPFWFAFVGLGDLRRADLGPALAHRTCRRGSRAGLCLSQARHRRDWHHDRHAVRRHRAPWHRDCLRGARARPCSRGRGQADRASRDRRARLGHARARRRGRRACAAGRPHSLLPGRRVCRCCARRALRTCPAIAGSRSIRARRRRAGCEAVPAVSPYSRPATRATRSCSPTPASPSTSR